MFRLLPLLVVLALIGIPMGVPRAQTPDAGPPPVRIGILYWSMQIPGQVAMRVGLEAELEVIDKQQAKTKRRRIETLVRVAGDGHAGIERQIKQMRELIQLDVDLIIVQPADNAALAKPLLEANRAGIPVVAYDQYISAGKLASFLTSNNQQAGFLCGEYIASLFPDKRTIKLVLVEYPHVSSTVARVNGFLDALESCGQSFEILATYQAIEPKSGAAAGAAILADYPARGSLDVVFTVNDGGGLAVVDALSAAKRDEIKVATIDGDERSIANIVADRLTVIDCAQFCGALGRETMRVAWAVLQGEEVPREVLVPVFPITKQTHELFLGWNSPPPKAFKKPWSSKTPKWKWALKIKPEPRPKDKHNSP